MITWKDQTIYSKHDTERTPTLWGLSVGRLTLTIMRRRDYPGTWFAQAEPFFGGFNPRDLETDDIDEAKRIAVDMLHTELRVALNLLDT